jgi:hypothetical protein
MRPTLLTLVFALGFGFAVAAPAPTDPWSREALTAWCIVPFDAAQRGPEARAVMLEKLNLRRFAYDWRRPLKETAVELATCLKALLQETAASGQPVRLLAHGMGGLLVRALVKTEEPLWNELMGRSGARFVMLGTPNQGSHQMVETLLGKSDLIRKLTRIDSSHSMQQILTIVAGFPGLLQLLPKPGFREAGDVQQRDDYFQEGVWQELKQHNQDRWT